jgi:hypothetical protein
MGKWTKKRAGVAATLVVGLFAGVVACGTKNNPPPGEIMLAVQTDMALPDDIDHVTVLAEVNGAVHFYQDYTYASGLRVPATIGFTTSNASEPVTFKVIGFKGAKARVLREAITTIPTNRLAVLPMPLSWLCDGQIMQVGSMGPDVTQPDFASNCPNPAQACVNGTCQDPTVDSSTLANYTPGGVFGGGSPDGGGSCFDTLLCFNGATDAQVDMTTCTIPAPADATKFNVALRQHVPGDGGPGDGICNADNSLCLVPLDSGPTGWFGVSSSAGPRIQLPAGVCKELAANLTPGLLATSACAAKTPSLPTCGPWSSIVAPETKDASAPSCTDGVKDGTESDVDCGGNCVFKCADNKSCTGSADCQHAYCNAQNKCATPTCSDMALNGNETDVDCGGGTCPPCAFGKGCANGSTDCTTGTCTMGKCSCPSGMVAVTPATGPLFCVDAHEVTNQQYGAFLPGPSVSTLPPVCIWKGGYHPAGATPNLPAANVDWCDAYAYCQSQGKRLCGQIGGLSNPIASFADATKSQWYDACTNGGANTYPYGATYGATTCNGAGYGAGAAIAVGQATQCIGGVPGLFDMSGNVSEWEDSCDSAGAGTAQNDNCRARGGAFSSQPADLQCNANLTYARSTTDASVGFRCCLF